MEISNGHHQVMASYPPNEVLSGIGCPKTPVHLSPELRERPPARPQEPLRCPRCDSSNTKFCYYNNYSLAQPRYFCKSCRRYWTKGGTLRNVPVGGGCRKNKRSSSSSSSPSRPSPPSYSKKLTPPQDRHGSFPALPLPPLSYDPSLLGNHRPNPAGHGFLDILKTGLLGPAEPSPAIGGLQSFYYGFGVCCDEEEVGGGDDGLMLPFNHDGGVRNRTTAEGTSASANASHGSSGGSYWNGAGWQGFINGFHHEIHDGV